MNIEAQFNLIAEEYDCNRRKLDKECSAETEIQMLNRCGLRKSNASIHIINFL